MTQVMLDKEYIIEFRDWVTLCSLDAELPLKISYVSIRYQHLKDASVYCEFGASISEGYIYSDVDVPLSKIKIFLELNAGESITGARIKAEESGVVITTQQLYNEVTTNRKPAPTKKPFWRFWE